MTDKFPANIKWGAATAAYQVEGAARIDGRGPSIWDVFCDTPGKTVRGETGEIACDHYHRWREDIDLMKRLNLQCYRFSVSWPRVMPTGRGAINQRGLDFYDRLIDGLCAANIAPMVTLYHWDLPAALQMEEGGWEHNDSPHWFADYAEIIFNRFGDRVSRWITLNEPWCTVDGGYFHGAHAPGVRDRPLGYRVGHNLMRAHAYAVSRYRGSQHSGGMISFAMNTAYYFPETNSLADIAAAERAILNFAGWFTDPPHFGDYPAVMRERLGDLLPQFSDEDARLLRRSMDYISLNYYTSDVVRYKHGAGVMDAEICTPPEVQRTEMGWPVYPDGYYKLLMWLHNRYGGLPLMITENGAAMPDKPDANGYVNDQDRIAYLKSHFDAVHRAMREGVDLREYYVWTLMDNLEWSVGYEKRFGLVHCDRQTLKRTIKASGKWYADFIASAAQRTLRQPAAVGVAQ